MGGDKCGGETVAKVLEVAASHGRVLVTTHRNADPDAVAAAVVARSFLHALGASVCIALPEGLSRAAKQALAASGARLEECGPDWEPRAILVVDASNTTQLGSLAEYARTRPLYIIDHHAPGDLALMAREGFIASGVSATQHVVNAGPVLGLRLTREEATLALAGIIYDSKRFQIADACAFAASAYLIEMGGDYTIALESLTAQRDKRLSMDYSERIARLKAAQRMHFARVCKEIIVAVTHVGAFEASAARAILELGADVAVVVGGGSGSLRASIRLSKRALEAGLRASEIAEYIALKLGGKGGGHEAAGMAHIDDGREPHEVASALARSLPGKIARICLERRGASGGSG